MNQKIEDILKRCNFPGRVITLDAETYTDNKYNLSKMSTYDYVYDERFELLGWAAKHLDNDATFSTDLPIKEMQINWSQSTIVMQNAKFDALILAKYYDIHPPYIIDTLDLARHIEPRQSNSLESLCERHNLPAKGDTKQFIGLHKEDFKDPQRWVDLCKYSKNDANQTYQLFTILLPYLSNPEMELELATYTRNLFLNPTLHFDFKAARKLKLAMLREKSRAIRVTQDSEEQISGNISFETLLREALGDTEPPMKIGKKGKILAIAKTDPGYDELLNHSNERVRALMGARIAIRSWPLHIKRINKMGQLATIADKKMPIPLLYYGCHTGRWSGSENINPQNLPARGHELANKIRSLIIAPPDYTLLILDFAQIEARVLAWLAEQNDLVQKFANGEEIYCDFASQLIGHKIRKARKTDKPVVQDFYGQYRQMGKIGILGAGYGMGEQKCMTYAHNTYKIDISSQMAHNIIKLYRQRNSAIVHYWTKVEQAFVSAILNNPQKYSLTYNLQFYQNGPYTVIQLPSKRCLYYTNVRLRKTPNRPTISMPNPASPTKQLHMWGGYLVENIVQAVSRDILAEAILRVEKLNFRIPLTVHDDMSILVLKDKVDQVRPIIEETVIQNPTWASNLPISIDSHVTEAYTK